jgi:serine/threonine protein kinase
LTNDDKIKLGDLGSARSYENDKIPLNAAAFVGTWPYISPEVRNKNYSFSTDIW